MGRMNQLRTWIDKNGRRLALWAVFMALLGVLLPHTAWSFSQFEPESTRWIGGLAALAFEGAIAALTWRLAGHIESAPRFRSREVRLAGLDLARRTFTARYINIYALGLLVATMVSSAANWAHAEQFGQPFVVFGRYSVPPLAYSLMFGAILPICSLLFARILADTSDSEHHQDPELVKAKGMVKDLRSQLRATIEALDAEKVRATRAEDAARVLLQLTAEEKAQRIMAAYEMWPTLSQSAIAAITNTSASYVSEILAEGRK